jgi:hypothetical protein
VKFRELVIKEFGESQLNNYESVITTTAPRYYPGFGHFEDQLIVFALSKAIHPKIGRKIIHKINEKYPGRINLNIIDPLPLLPETEEHDFDDLTDYKNLLIKTDGGSDGLRLAGAGFRDGKPRSLSSYDRPSRPGGGAGSGVGSDDGGNWISGTDMGDDGDDK